MTITIYVYNDIVSETEIETLTRDNKLQSWNMLYGSTSTLEDDMGFILEKGSL